MNESHRSKFNTKYGAARARFFDVNARREMGTLDEPGIALYSEGSENNTLA